MHFMQGMARRRLQHSAEAVISTSILNPLLWLCGIGVPLVFGSAHFLRGPLRVVAIVLGLIPFLLTTCAYCYWTVVAPDRLQSEEYRLQAQALEIWQAKNTPPVIEGQSDASYIPSEMPPLAEGGSDQE